MRVIRNKYHKLTRRTTLKLSVSLVFIPTTLITQKRFVKKRFTIYYWCPANNSNSTNINSFE